MTLLDHHRRLRTIGRILLQNEQLSDEDREFLGNALVAISSGEDATAALEIKPHRGESSFKTQKRRNVRDKHIFGWIATAIAPESEGGLGLSLKEAAKKLKKDQLAQIIFAIDADTIERYWKKYPSKRKRTFKLD